jgi:hypothetical protein
MDSEGEKPLEPVPEQQEDDGGTRIDSLIWEELKNGEEEETRSKTVF